MPSLARALLLSLTCAVAQLSAAQSAPPNVHKVSAPPALIPLTLFIGGRVQTTPATNANFGGHNYTYQWPGTYFRAAFQGATVYFRIINGDQILHIDIDDLPPAILAKPQPGTYEVDRLANTRTHHQHLRRHRKPVRSQHLRRPRHPTQRNPAPTAPPRAPDRIHRRLPHRRLRQSLQHPHLHAT